MAAGVTDRLWAIEDIVKLERTDCPSVEITDRGVTIGEDGNSVTLTHVEWNDLVARIKRGELREIA
jgi:hypothetical protein